MRIETLLNSCIELKRFVISNVKFTNSKKSLVATIVPRKNSKAQCSKCGCLSPCYDKLSLRRFEFIPVWGYHVYFEYIMRRVNCRNCNSIIVEEIPWSSGKSHLTKYYAKYLSDWAKEMAWKTVATRFRTSWQTVHRAVESIVDFGLKNRSIENVTALGIDEVQYHNGHNYMTLVYQIDNGCRRLLWVGKGRTIKTLNRFFADMWNIDRKFRGNIKVVCTDMWKAYLTVLKLKVPNAVNVLDKFHIMQKFGKALDQVRVSEVKRLKAQGDEVILKNSRWCFLKRVFNLTKSQKGRLKELINLNLNIVKAYILKEQFYKFWEYNHPAWAHWRQLSFINIR